LLEAEGGPLSEVAETYAACLREVAGLDYSQIAPLELRVAYMHLAIGSRVYLDKRYYGLEMFALAMFARSYLEARQLTDNPTIKELALDVQKRSSLEIEKTLPLVNATWTKMHLPGVFESISRYMDIRNEARQSLNSIGEPTLSDRALDGATDRP
jgi:hypothetical protein